MKIHIFLVIIVALTAASSIEAESSEPSNEYLPPLDSAEGSGDSTAVGADGYEYRTVKRFKYRHRRDVSELPNQEYLPPGSDEPNEDAAPVGQDGYQYKTVKRLRYRNRRDVSELPNQEYLPPSSAPSTEYLPPNAGEPNGDSTQVGPDGYRYKTVKRLRYRHRRDVSELPNQEYLPPNSAPNTEYLPPNSDSSSADSTPIDKDGYRYRTVKRFRYRNRRDVSELPNQEYLPPNASPSSDYLPPLANGPAGDSTAVGKDGYEYKTAKRLRYRLRRH